MGIVTLNLEVIYMRGQPGMCNALRPTSDLDCVYLVGALIIISKERMTSFLERVGGYRSSLYPLP